MARRTKVLMIAGCGRSGSTLLADVLGLIDGWINIGELQYIWDRGILEDRYCGCGQHFSSCNFWSEVMTVCSTGSFNLDPNRLLRIRSKLRNRHLVFPRVLSRRLQSQHDLNYYVSCVSRIYNTISDVAAVELIVDSSKFPSHLFAVNSCPDVELYVVHLVRDPRAVAYSWSRRQKLDPGDPSGFTMPFQGVFRSALEWNLWNLIIERFGRENRSRYLMVRYEDFARRPGEIVREILALVPGEYRAAPLIEDGRIQLRTSHSVSGNPSRFDTGVVTIAGDDEWKRKLPSAERRLVSTTCGPWLKKYRY